MGKDIEKMILEALRKAIIGLTTTDLANKLKVSRLTIMKYLQSLKGRGILIDKQVGAYRLWMLKDNMESKRKLISRKLACVLAESFLELYGDSTPKIAFEIGKKIAIKYIKNYPEDYELLKSVEGDAFEKIAAVVEFISEKLNVEGFSLGNGDRGIIRIRGQLCEKDDVSDVLIELINGAIIGFLEREVNAKFEIRSRKKVQREDGVEVIIEVCAGNID